jgi:hypothetical protein
MPASTRSITPLRTAAQPPLLRAEAALLDECIASLGERIARLERRLDDIPEPAASLGAAARLRLWLSGIHDVYVASARLREYLHDYRCAPFFQLDGPLTTVVRAIFAWCDHVASEIEEFSRKLRRRVPVLALFPEAAVSLSLVRIERTADHARAALRAAPPSVQPLACKLEADFDELLWATEWLHLSLGKKPGAGT